MARASSYVYAWYSTWNVRRFTVFARGRPRLIRQVCEMQWNGTSVAGNGCSATECKKSNHYRAHKLSEGATGIIFVLRCVRVSEAVGFTVSIEW